MTRLICLTLTLFYVSLSFSFESPDHRPPSSKRSIHFYAIKSVNSTLADQQCKQLTKSYTFSLDDSGNDKTNHPDRRHSGLKYLGFLKHVNENGQQLGLASADEDMVIKGKKTSNKTYFSFIRDMTTLEATGVFYNNYCKGAFKVVSDE